MSAIVKNAKTVKDYILAQNMAAEFFTVAGIRCWSSKLMGAECWEADYGITTVEELEDHLDAEYQHSVSDQMYYWYQDWEREMAAAEAADAAYAAKLVAEGEKAFQAPLTHNPFAALAAIQQ